MDDEKTRERERRRWREREQRLAQVQDELLATIKQVNELRLELNALRRQQTRPTRTEELLENEIRELEQKHELLATERDALSNATVSDLAEAVREGQAASEK